MPDIPETVPWKRGELKVSGTFFDEFCFYSLTMKVIIMGTRPLLYAPLAYPFFLLSVAQSVSSCCRLLKVVTMSQLRKITSFLFLF